MFWLEVASPESRSLYMYECPARLGLLKYMPFLSTYCVPERLRKKSYESPQTLLLVLRIRTAKLRLGSSFRSMLDP
jgi:hypothetical protein